jgi:hypothetical protein
LLEGDPLAESGHVLIKFLAKDFLGNGDFLILSADLFDPIGVRLGSEPPLGEAVLGVLEEQVLEAFAELLVHAVLGRD